jgi:signal transduction histidine kinase
MMGTGAKQPRVLVVDDEKTNRDGLEKVLSSEDFVVACASDGPSALEQVARFDPDIVLTDLGMPGLDGIELCAKLREVDAELPVILMTVHDEPLSILRGLRAGIDDFLAKPLDVELVLLSLRRAIAKRAMQLEQKRLRAHNQLLFEESLATLTRYEEVLSVVSHDLRNPLAIINLCGQRLVAQYPELDGNARSTAETILRAVARSNRLVDNLLAEARLRHSGVILERREHPVDDLLGDVSDLRPLALQSGLTLDVEPIHTRRTLFCDRQKMSQVLSNLVGNAIKFSPAGATVRVWAEDGERETRFAVRDTGPGIAADALPHLFERYWQSPGRSLPGIGLGLYIAKGIVDAHGGAISVEASEGTGSTFFVSIPTASPPKAA